MAFYAGLLVLLGVVAWCLPLFINPFTLHPAIPLQGPTWHHWLGTDDLGRDLLSRAALGAQLSLGIGLSTAVLATVMGTLVGMWAGHKGGWMDQLCVRAMDILYSLPLLMVVVLLSLWMGRGVNSLIIALTFLCWPDTARLIRGHTQQLSQLEFIEAFKSLGGQTYRLYFTHLLPNIVPYVAVSMAMLVPRVILTESTLSFIGLGVEAPLSSWGTLTSEGWQLVRIAPHLLLVPASLIIISMSVLHLLSQAIQQQLNHSNIKA
jgi:oligopeptide transport system permease protein